MREQAREYAQRIQAWERVQLRRWLRNHLRLEDLPEHLYLEWGREQLMDEVDRLGGDADAILRRAQKEMVEWLSEKL